MTQDEYIKERLEGQINWYDKKSMDAQRWFKKFRAVEIISAALIPVLAGFGGPSVWVDLFVCSLGALVVVIASLLSLNQFQENWVKYRTTCETLKHEKFLYLTKVQPYNGEKPFGLLVQRVEGLISEENSSWSQLAQSGLSAEPESNSIPDET